MDFWQRRMRENVVLRIDLCRNGIKDWKAIPIWINDNFQPELLKGKEAEKVLQRVSHLSRLLEQDDLSNSVLRGDKYKNDVARLHRNYRKEVIAYYLRHLLAYDPRILLQNAMVVGKRRVMHKKL